MKAFSFWPVSIKDANNFVRKFHRHSLPTAGGKFAIKLTEVYSDKTVGVAICGRPVARLLDDGVTAEILRVCTDGTKNANSCLYRRAARILKLLGYQSVITYSLTSESESSLRGVGARKDKRVEAYEWNRPSRVRDTQDVYTKEKWRWLL